jgi:hypothetical protein
MDGERNLAVFHRLSSLWEKFRNKRYRDGYVAAHTRSVLARQMRNFRGARSQAEFGALIGKRQTVVSRLESPAYGSWTLRTMFEVARKMNVAVFVRFVDFPTFLRYTDDMSDDALDPKGYDQMPPDMRSQHETAPLPNDISQFVREFDPKTQRKEHDARNNIDIHRIIIAPDPGKPLSVSASANDDKAALAITAS